jgi:hypothetical protein
LIGITAFILIFAIWIFATILLYDKNGRNTSTIVFYYLIMGLLVALHPLIGKMQRKSKGIKIPKLVYVFSYACLIFMCFPMQHFIGLFNWFSDNRLIQYIPMATIVSLPVAVGKLIVFVIEKVKKQKNIQLQNKISHSCLFLTLSFAFCIVFGEILYNYWLIPYLR